MSCFVGDDGSSGFEASLGHTVFVRSLAMLGHARTGPVDAEQAASMAQFAAKYVTLDERLTSDVMNVIANRLSEPRVVDALVHAVRGCLDPERAAAGIERAVRRAHDGNLLLSFVVLVGAMQLVPSWQRPLSAPWLLEGIQRSFAESPRRAALQLLSIMDRQQRVPAHFLEVFERHPALLTNPWIGAGHAWRIHQARPTVGGWCVLGSSRAKQAFAVTPAGFGSELDVAVETLEVAIGNAEARPTRTTLTRWLCELGGGTGDAP